MLPEVLAFVLLAVMLAAHEIGYRCGCRVGLVDEDYKRHVEMIRNAILGLVTFLVGFSFAAAGTRYIDRQDMIVKEANAIGTSYLRAMLLPERQRDQLQATLRQYTNDRLRLLHVSDEADRRRRLGAVGGMQAKIWQAGIEGVGGDRVLATLVLPPLNELIDLHTAHLSAAQRHIPTMILALIVVMTALGMLMLGYDSGLVRRRYFVLSSLFGVVAAASLWVTVDLDRPRLGFIRVSDLPYLDLLQSMNR
ncbi:MAG: hypothetical protein FJX11_05710 [Alphaproteobacteria bacterium]|nr:hypothetical protein [Alphaproteobacteria bacterium]